MSLQFAGEVSMLNEQGEHSGMLIRRDSWDIRSLQGFSISESQVLMVSLRRAKTVAGLSYTPRLPAERPVGGSRKVTGSKEMKKRVGPGGSRNSPH